MIAEHTKRAIAALLAIDGNATEAERAAVLDAIDRYKGPVVLSFKEVAFRLGKSCQTVYNLIKAGRLKTVKGTGSYCTGVTAESLQDYLLDFTEKPSPRRH